MVPVGTVSEIQQEPVIVHEASNKNLSSRCTKIQQEPVTATYQDPARTCHHARCIQGPARTHHRDVRSSKNLSPCTSIQQEPVIAKYQDLARTCRRDVPRSSKNLSQCTRHPIRACHHNLPRSSKNLTSCAMYPRSSKNLSPCTSIQQEPVIATYQDPART